MVRPSVLCLALMGATACGVGSPKLEGHWRGVRVEGAAADGDGPAEAFADAMDIECHRDTLSVTSPKEKQSGKYRVIHEDKHTVIIATEKDGDDEPQTFTFADEETMRWMVAPGTTIVFRRVN